MRTFIAATESKRPFSSFLNEGRQHVKLSRLLFIMTPSPGKLVDHSFPPAVDEASSPSHHP
jgi:hypothetical protein